MSYQTKLTTCVLGVLALLAVSIPANANFIGDTVSVNYEWPDVGTILYSGGSMVIPSGRASFDVSNGGITVDVTNSNILVTFNGGWNFSTAPKTFDGIVVTDLTANITGVSLASTNISGYIASDLSSDGHDVFINFPFPPFATLPTGASISVDALFAAPEPGPFVLLGAGLLGIGLLYRRRVSVNG